MSIVFIQNKYVLEEKNTHLEMAQIASQLDENKENLADQANDLYTGPLANRSIVVYENLQYGYGKLGDGLSSMLHWLGENVIKAGHTAGSLISSSFHTIGDLFGTTVDKTEHLVGTGLIKGSEKLHFAGQFTIDYFCSLY